MDRRYSERHAQLLAEPAPTGTDHWSEQALRACLEHLRTSTVTQAGRVSVVEAWTDGPDAFCVVYHPPFDERRTVGLRRRRQDAAQPGDWRLGDMTTWGYDVGRDGAVDPRAFGWNVADFDLGEPLGVLVSVLRFDEAAADGVGWWGDLGEQLPSPPG